MKRILLLTIVFILFVSLFGCSPDTESAKVDVNPYLEDTELNNYIKDIDKDVSYSYKDKTEDSDYYQINIKVKSNESFSMLDKGEKFELLSNITEELADMNLYPECGSVECQLGKLTVVDKDKATFSMEIETHINGASMYADGVEYREEDLIYYTEDDSIEEANSSSSLEDDVYDYMEILYDELTNEGENYVPEIHDPQVAKAAAAKFGITEKEAGDIYVEKAVESVQ